MKIKNIGPIDRHLHKAIPVVALLFLLGVVWFYVLGEPYSITVRNQELSPVQVEEKVGIAAKQLEDRINSPTDPLPPMKLPPYTDDFQKRARRPLVNKSRLDVPLGEPGLDPRQFPVDQPPPSQYMVHTPPPATDLKTRSDFGVLALPAAAADRPDVQKELKEWAKLAGNHEPHDVRYVTVSGTFNMAEWRHRLESPAGGETIQIPQQWWRPRLVVTDVILERQTLDPATGEWGSTETIDTLPNNKFAVLRQWSDQYKGGDPIETVTTIRLEQEQITHQPPPPLGTDHPWAAPGADGTLSEDQQKRLAALDVEIHALQERLGHMGGGLGSPGLDRNPAPGLDRTMPSPSRPMPPGPSPMGPGGAAGPGGMGGAMGPGSGMSGRPSQAKPSGSPGVRPGSEGPATERAKLTEQLNEKMAERNRILGAKTVAKPEAQAGAQSLDKVEVWAHDLTVKPGMTYRYRVEISVLNPLFQSPSLNHEQRHDYFDKLSMTSDAEQEQAAPFKDAWSAPVTIDREVYFFVTNANPASRSVTVEVWRVINGAWRPKEFAVQAGDPIGDTAAVSAGSGTRQVDMSVNALAVDIDFNAAVVNQPYSQSTTRLIYFDKSSGRLLSRTMQADRADPRREHLRTQSTVGSMAEKPQ